MHLKWNSGQYLVMLLIMCNNVINYVQYDRSPRDFYNLDVKVLDQKILGKFMTDYKKKMDRL